MPDLKELFARESRLIVALLLAMIVVHALWDLWAPGPAWVRVGLFSGLALGLALMVSSRSKRLHDHMSGQLDGLAEMAERVQRGEDSGEHAAFGIPQMDRAERALTRISRIIQDHDRLRAQLQSLQRQQVVGILAQELANDLTNRLTVVLAQLDLAMDGLAESDPRRLRLRHAENAAKASVQCAQSIRAFGSTSHPPGALLDLNRLVEKVCTLLRRVLGDNIRVVLELGTALPLVQGSEVQLEQVVMNLGLNARQAMSEGGILTFRTGRSDEGWAALSVEDTGIGISPQLLDRIWQPFFSTRPPEDGVGLGLATAKEILQEHHGRIQVASHPGQGSVFTVLLPPASEQTAELPRAESARSRPSLEGTRILMAEDEPEIRMVLKELLSRMGAEVVVAVDGEDAWNLWELLGPFDLLITDQRMPRLNGLGLLKRIRAIRPDFPVLVMTGFGLEEAASLLGGDPRARMLAKPFTVPVLTEAITGLVGAMSAQPGAQG